MTSVLDTRLRSSIPERRWRAGGGCCGCGIPLLSRERDARHAALLRVGAAGRRGERQGACRVPRALGSWSDAAGVRASDAIEPGADPECSRCCLLNVHSAPCQPVKQRQHFPASWSTFLPWKVRTARGRNLSVTQAILSFVRESWLARKLAEISQQGAPRRTGSSHLRAHRLPLGPTTPSAPVPLLGRFVHSAGQQERHFSHACSYARTTRKRHTAFSVAPPASWQFVAGATFMGKSQRHKNAARPGAAFASVPLFSHDLDPV